MKRLLSVQIQRGEKCEKQIYKGKMTVNLVVFERFECMFFFTFTHFITFVVNLKGFICNGCVRLKWEQFQQRRK